MSDPAFDTPAAAAAPGARARALRALLRLDARLARLARVHGRLARLLHELVWFGLKQAWACLFGGAIVALLFAT